MVENSGSAWCKNWVFYVKSMKIRQIGGFVLLPLSLGFMTKKYNKFDWLAFKAVNMERRTGIIIDLDLSLYLKVQ